MCECDLSERQIPNHRNANPKNLETRQQIRSKSAVSDCFQPPRVGFTLIELLVVIAVIGVLVALFLPAIQSARESARRLQCGSYLRQMGLALVHHEEQYKRYPAGCKTSPNLPSLHRLLWSGAILPFLEQNTLRLSLDPDSPWDTPGSPNEKALQFRFPLFQCPSSDAPRSQDIEIPRRYPSTYLACASGLTARESGPGVLLNALEVDGVFYTDSTVRQSDIMDGTSSTILIGESLFLNTTSGPDYNGVNQLIDHWAIGTPGMGPNEMSEALGSTASPINAYRIKSSFIEDIELGYASRHTGGAQVVFADGHILFVSQNIDRDTWSAFGTRYSLDIANYVE